MGNASPIHKQINIPSTHKSYGAQRQLRIVRDQEAGSSNLLTPTIRKRGCCKLKTCCSPGARSVPNFPVFMRKSHENATQLRGKGNFQGGVARTCNTSFFLCLNFNKRIVLLAAKIFAARKSNEWENRTK